MLTLIPPPALLRRLFELSCRYSGQILSYNKMLGQLHPADTGEILGRVVLGAPLAALLVIFHFHVLVLDGVFTENEDGVVAFREATDLTPELWQTLQRTVQVRVLRTTCIRKRCPPTSRSSRH